MKTLFVKDKLSIQHDGLNLIGYYNRFQIWKHPFFYRWTRFVTSNHHFALSYYEDGEPHTIIFDTVTGQVVDMVNMDTVDLRVYEPEVLLMDALNSLFIFYTCF